jgi:hypothetical protein
MNKKSDMGVSVSGAPDSLAGNLNYTLPQKFQDPGTDVFKTVAPFDVVHRTPEKVELQYNDALKPTVLPTDSEEYNNNKSNTTQKDLDGDQIDRSRIDGPNKSAIWSRTMNEQQFYQIDNIDTLIKTAEDNSIKKKIMECFAKNENPPDAKIHKMAEKLGIEPDKLEEAIYKLLSSFLSQGKSKDYTGEYDPKELAMGIKIEMEHTNDKDIAERIAKDHLSEFGGKYYYTELKKLEKQLEDRVK